MEAPGVAGGRQVEDVDEGSDGSNDDDIEVRGAETTSPKWPSQRASSKIVPISAVASLVQPSSTTSKAPVMTTVHRKIRRALNNTCSTSKAAINKIKLYS